MKKWIIQTIFYPDEWDVVNAELFDTKAEAEAELKSLIADMKEAVELGYMEDSDADAWRVAAIEVQE